MMLATVRVNNGGSGEAGVLVVGEAGYATALVEAATLAQLEEVVALLTDLKWVDPTRLAVFGAGRGGHTALSVLLANTVALSNLHCGAVQAPITDWALGRKNLHYFQEL